MQVELVGVPYDDPRAEAVLVEVHRENTARYGGPDRSPVDAGDFALPDGRFVLAQVDGAVVGCAALRRHDATSAELKRMFVFADHRRRGIANLLLSRLEDLARTMGYDRLVLETGVAQPEAIALYEAAGYRTTTPFGHYAASPLSRSYAKSLV